MPNAKNVSLRFPLPSEGFAYTGERFVPGTIGDIEQEHLHRYLFASNLCEGRDVLDVASGEGYGSAFLATMARSVVGVELDPDVVAHAARAYSAPNLVFRVGDCTELPLDSSSVDVVVSFETIEHIHDHDRFLREIRRVLRPDGLLVISSPVRGVFSAGNPNPYHVRELTRAELEELLRAHFRTTVLCRQTPVVGTALLADGDESTAAITPHNFVRQEDGSFQVEPGWGTSPYVVAVSSDGVIPPLRSGLLHDPTYVWRLLAKIEADRIRAHDAREEELAERATALDERAAELERREGDVSTRAAELTSGEAALALRIAEPGAARKSGGCLRSWADSLKRRLQVVRIAKSGLFDAAWFRATYPDVGRNRHPIRHFVKFGRTHGLNPHPMFDTAWYLRQNPDAARSGVNPLVHFIEHGAAAGLKPHPLYSAQEYLASARTR